MLTIANKEVMRFTIQKRRKCVFAVFPLNPLFSIVNTLERILLYRVRLKKPLENSTGKKSLAVSLRAICRLLG